MACEKKTCRAAQDYQKNMENVKNLFSQVAAKIKTCRAEPCHGVRKKNMRRHHPNCQNVKKDFSHQTGIPGVEQGAFTLISLVGARSVER